MTIIGIFLNIEISTGGHARYLKLLQGLAEKKCNVVLYYNSRLSLDLTDVELVPVDVFYVRHQTKNLSSLFAKSLAAVLRKKTCHFFSSGLEEKKYIIIFGETHWKAAKILSKFSGVDILFSQRSDSIQESLMYLKYEKLNIAEKIFNILYIIRQYFREKEIAKKAAIVFFQSKNDSNNFLRRVGKCKASISVVRNDIRQERFKLEYALSNNSAQCRNILFIGTLGRRKGVIYLLKAVAELYQENIPFTLKIFGPGSTSDKSKVLNFIEQNNLASLISVFGRTENPFEELKYADLLVVPSLFDSYPNTILEAIHCGVPVVAASCGGIPDMLRYSELLFPPADSKSIYNILRKIIVDDNEYLHYRELCRLRRDFFDFDWAQAWLDEINHL